MTKKEANKLIGRMFLVNLDHYKRPGKAYEIIGVVKGGGVYCVKVPEGEGHNGGDSEWLAGNPSVLKNDNAWYYVDSEGSVVPGSIKLVADKEELKEEPRLFNFDDL
jgi:hypothetical protein